MATYPIVLLTNDAGDDFDVIVPDLPGCYCGGETVEQAMHNAREAIELHIAGLREDGDVPAPQPISRHLHAPTFADGIWAMVSIDEHVESAA